MRPLAAIARCSLALWRAAASEGAGDSGDAGRSAVVATTTQLGDMARAGGRRPRRRWTRSSSRTRTRTATSRVPATRRDQPRPTSCCARAVTWTTGCRDLIDNAGGDARRGDRSATDARNAATGRRPALVAGPAQRDRRPWRRSARRWRDGRPDGRHGLRAPRRRLRAAAAPPRLGRWPPASRRSPPPGASS